MVSKNSITARIYLSKNRTYRQIEGVRTATSRFLNPIDNATICEIQDVQLSIQRVHKLELDPSFHYLILPLVGGIELQEANTNSLFVLNGTVYHYPTSSFNTVTIVNPYEKETIRFLIIQYAASTNRTCVGFSQNLALSQHKNQVIPLQSDNVKIAIGQYSGRSEDTYQKASSNSILLGYSIYGAFEFQNRLLESNDGLVLHGISEIEWEALSDNALMLLLDFADYTIQ